MRSVKKRVEAVSLAEKAVSDIGLLIPTPDELEEPVNANENPEHLEDFNAVLRRAAPPVKSR